MGQWAGGYTGDRMDQKIYQGINMTRKEVMVALYCGTTGLWNQNTQDTPKWDYRTGGLWGQVTRRLQKISAIERD